MALTKHQTSEITLRERGTHPVKASTEIFGSAAVGLDSNGFARNLVAGDTFAGFVGNDGQKNETAVDGGGPPVDLAASGFVTIDVTGVNGHDDVGKIVYASDSNTFNVTTPTGNSKIGRVFRWLAGTKCVVAFFATSLQV